MASNENLILKQCLQYLRVRGLYVWRNNNLAIKGRYFIGMKGVGDIIGLLPCGKFISVEVKTDTGKVSNDQHKFIMDVRSNNGVGIVVRSLTDIKQKIRCSDSCERLVKHCPQHG